MSRLAASVPSSSSARFGVSWAAAQSAARTVPGRLVLGLAATAVLAAAAHIVFPLPFTPVPFILTPLAVLGVGLAFGPVEGFAVLIAYLLEGVCGLPVFSPGTPGGLAHLLGPTGGFLMSYPAVAFVAGLARNAPARTPRFLAATVSGLAAVGLLFACGALWLAHWDRLFLGAAPSAHTLAMTAVVPFLPGELIKILAAAGVYSSLRRAQ